MSVPWREENVGVRNGGLFSFFSFFFLKTYQEAPNRQTDWKGEQIFTCTA